MHELVSTLERCEGAQEFSPKTFFTEWFCNHDNAYFFLFRKNVKVTNLQFAELVALVEAEVTDSEAATRVPALQFATVADFNGTFAGLITPFAATGADGRTRAQLFADIYGSVLERLVVVEVFSGACAVYLPPHLKINLAAVCGLSGYIHSCGHLIFSGSVYWTRSEDFVVALRRKLETSLLPTFFSVYAHEDFTEFDRKDARNLRDGLDDVKVFVEKFYMGSERLVDVLKNVRTSLAGKLEIADPTDFREEHKSFRERSDVDHQRTLWLVVDHPLTKSCPRGSTERYYLCYEQLFKNENPFHVLDENKPAWVAHTTIPHTLLGAMINITRPNWPQSNVVIADPFAGTGTTALELLKYDNVHYLCGDTSELAPLLFRDNLWCFSASTSELQQLIDGLSSYSNDVAVPKMFAPANPGKQAFQVALGEFERVIGDFSGDAFVPSTEFVARFERQSILARLFFYVFLRTTVRYVGKFSRSENSMPAAWSNAFEREARQLREQLEDLKKLRLEKEVVRLGRISIIQGWYSPTCTFSITVKDGEQRGAVQVRDAVDLEAASCDVIITDPPYGFNTDDDYAESAELYSRFISVLVRALRGDAQLVIALPAWSHTGRHIPHYALQGIVTQQVLVAAQRHGKEIMHAANLMPEPMELFRPPYYWESDRALKRSILHFRIREKT